MVIGRWILFSEITILPKKIENWGEVWLSMQVILHNSPFESKKLLLCLISLPFYQIPLGGKMSQTSWFQPSVGLLWGRAG